MNPAVASTQISPWCLAGWRIAARSVADRPWQRQAASLPLFPAHHQFPSPPSAHHQHFLSWTQSWPGIKLINKDVYIIIIEGICIVHIYHRRWELDSFTITQTAISHADSLSLSLIVIRREWDSHSVAFFYSLISLSPSLSLLKNSLNWSLLYYCSVHMMWCFRQKFVFCLFLSRFFL